MNGFKTTHINSDVFMYVLLICLFCCDICWVSNVSKVLQEINVKSLAGGIVMN